jgi:hypothetical protein
MPTLSELRKVFDVVMDSYAAVVLLLFGLAVFPVNPFLGTLCLVAIIDQIDDVYFALFGRHIYPNMLIFRICNFLLELVCLLIALGIYVFATIYFHFFTVPFWFGVLVLSLALVYSTIRDIVASFKKTRREDIAETEFV